MNRNILYLIGIIILSYLVIIYVSHTNHFLFKEPWGVFGARATLKGIANQTHSHYSLAELAWQYPTGYWYNTGCNNGKNWEAEAGKPQTVYDRDVQSYLSQYFDPDMTE